MGMLLLWCAASIIVPIIKAEGIIAVFFPYLVRQPQVRPFAPMQSCLWASRHADMSSWTYLVGRSAPYVPA